MSNGVHEIFKDTKLLAVVEIAKAANGPPLAEALLKGGIHTLEVTMRTDAAIEALEQIATKVAGINVGLGTLIEADQFRYAYEAGALFTTSPGLNLDLLSVAEEEKMPYLPGVFTPSEVMLARDLDVTYLKFSPAYLPAGFAHFNQIARAFPKLSFCLTGGVNADNYLATLAKQGVTSVGGSWIAPRKLIDDQDWSQITERVKVMVQAVAELQKD